MKPKRRILSLLLTICLIVGLIPTVAFAADTGKAIQLGASNINGYDSTNGYDYIYYGEWNSSPIKWRVLDTKTNMANATEGDGLFLLSDVLLGTGDYGGVSFDSTSPYRNAWQGSDAQDWCETFYNGSLTTQEQSAVLETTKSDGAFTSSTYSVPFAASENILNGDKVFFLSAEEAENSAYGFTDDNARIANYGNSAGVWWLRSPRADYTLSAGAVYYYGYVDIFNVFLAWAARPAFNVNLNSVLFTSAAEGGKIPAASSGGNQGGEAADAIFEIPTTTTSEWKLTLLDSSRNFSVTETAASGKSGDTITLNYTGATTGTNEYISVIIEDNGGAKYYGRIMQPTSADGQISITIPSGLADGTYTLNVFSEQYNGGDNDDTKLTDYASAFETVALTVDNTAPTLTAGAVSRTSDTEATVKFTSGEAGMYYYEVVESGAAAPTISTSGTGTACSNGENTIDLTTLTAGAKEIYIVVKDAAGNVSSALKIEIPAYVAPVLPVYSISADTTTLDFGSVQTGYTTPAAQTITVTNTGNQQITLTQPTASNYTIGVLSKTNLAAGETANFTVQPKSGLAVGTYNETITVKGASGGNSTNEISISADFTVQSVGADPVPDHENPPVIISPTKAQDIFAYVGDTAIMSVTATDADSYQWYVDRGNGFEAITGATGASYTTAKVELTNDGYRYYCVAKNAYGTDTSPVFTLRVMEQGELDDVPKTGDNSQTGLWIGLMMIALAGLAACAVLYRKRKQER